MNNLLEMRKLIYILAVIVSCYSCLDDEGNYDYIDPGTIDFSGMVTEVNAVLGEHLFIDGKFTTSADESDLSYAWFTSAEDENYKSYADTLCTTKNFDQILVTNPDEGTILIYSVYNNKLDVHYYHEITLSVVTPFSTGWGILKEKNGKAELDFISEINEAPTFYNDVLTNITKVSPEGKPLSLDYHWNVWEPYSRATILTDQDGLFIDAFSMSKLAGIFESFQSIDYINLPFTGGYLGQHAFWEGDVGGLFANGKIYLKAGRGYNDNFWEAPIEGDYIVTGQVCGVLNAVLLFDEKNRRYIYVPIGDYATYSDYKTYVFNEDSDAFDPNNLNKDCIWMAPEVGAGASLWGASVYAALKDDAGKYYLQNFTADSYDFTATLEIELPDGLVDENSQFLNNGVYPYTYLTQGSVIHRFSQKTEGIEQDYLNIGSDIKDIAIDHDGEILAVVVDNGAGSTIIMRDLVNNVEVARYEIDSKVVDLKYKRDDW